MEGAGMDDDKGDREEEERGNGDADERDWRQLLPELLNVIYEQLPDFLDCIYFRATCKAWNLPVPLPEATPCHPWIFDPYKSYDSSFRFYAFTSNVAISVPARDDNLTFNRSQYHNTSYGYLLYYHHETAAYYFINPLTGEENVLLNFNRDVPVPLHLLRVLWAQEDIVISTIHVSYIPESYLCKVTFHKFGGGEDTWERVGHVQRTLIGRNAAFELYDEMYYINTDFRENTAVIGATTGEFLDIVPLPEVEDHPVNGERLLRRFNYLVKSSGELLLIYAVAYIRVRPMVRRYIFSVYRLEDGDDGTDHWVTMGGIGDRAIFLNEFDGFSLESNKYPRLKKNSIYFMRSTTERVIGDDDADDNPFNNNRTVIVASRYDLETGLVEDFPYTMNYWGSWFLPELYC